MWTPKRILILIAGLALFVTGYGVYVFFLGGIDGLPPLADVFLPGDGPTPGPINPPPVTSIDAKLSRAFGAECPELHRSIKIDIPSRGWGMAADLFEPQPDGRIKLMPFSGFLIAKKQKADAKFPEINTLRCDEAYLTLNEPATTAAELGNRKVVRVELRTKPPKKSKPEEKEKPQKKDKVDLPGMVIKNNRGTPEEHDDLELFIPESPVHFDETSELIWTEGEVQLTDKQSKPQPTRITARGMKLHLTKDPAMQAQGKAKGNGLGISGVEKLVLLSNVDMHLWVDSRSGFLGNEAGGPRPSPGPTEKSHLFVQTLGPFVYDLRKDMAFFDIPKGATREIVQVMREHRLGEGKARKEPPTDKTTVEPPALFDKLKCHHLELQFRKPAEKVVPEDKPAVEDKGDSSQSIDKEIESARATALPGQKISLVMETDNLAATGTELFYYSPTGDGGAQTIIKGQPLEAVKDGHIIHAKELLLVGANKDGKGQRAFAKGPGQIDMFDKARSTDERPLYPWHAFWKDTLTSVKDQVGGRDCDLITLSGDASFVDEEHQQELHGQKLQVWLVPTDRAKSNGTTTTSTASTGSTPALSGQRPIKIDAYENVSVMSPDMKVKKADHLLVHFDEPMPMDDRLPDRADEPGSSLGSPLTIAGPGAAASSGRTQAGAGGVLAGKNAAPPKLPDSPTASASGNGEPAKARKPIELEARQVTAYVTPKGPRHDIREVVADGSVHVQQEPADPKDKGVDIKGEMLNLLHHPQNEGDTLRVFGDAHRPAELHLGELILIGPQVTINQRDNVAEVEGVGAMQMPSNTTFNGDKPAKEASRLTIHWNKNMLFDGKYAHFHGGVTAYQDNASLRCQDLQVTLDRVVSFKEGEKGGQKAKVEILVCDRKVLIVDELRDDKGNLLSYRRLEGPQVKLDNPVETVVASGPGRTLFLEKGSGEQPLGPVSASPKSATPANVGVMPAPKQPRDPQDPQMQLTRIEFLGSMSSNNKDNLRTSTFYDNVEVMHCPADRPDVEMNPDRPPKDGFYLRCNKLRVYTRNDGKGKNSQYMWAEQDTFFRTVDFYGRAAMIKYNQSTETIIFEGTPGNPATLYQEPRAAGQEPRQIQGNKILYNRRTGTFQIEGGQIFRWD